jgi:hypothetical protein
MDGSDHRFTTFFKRREWGLKLLRILSKLLSLPFDAWGGDVGGFRRRSLFPGKQMEYTKLLRFVAQECVFYCCLKRACKSNKEEDRSWTIKDYGENPYLVVKLKSLSFFVSFLLPPPPAICDKVERSIPAQKWAPEPVIMMMRTSELPSTFAIARGRLSSPKLAAKALCCPVYRWEEFEV